MAKINRPIYLAKNYLFYFSILTILEQSKWFYTVSCAHFINRALVRYYITRDLLATFLFFLKRDQGNLLQCKVQVLHIVRLSKLY